MVGTMFGVFGDSLGFRRSGPRNGLCCIMMLSVLLLLVAMAEEFPEMTEPQVCEWVLEKWRGLDEMDEILERYG
jgi:hypothetical protein